VHHRAQLLGMKVVNGEVEYTIQHHLGGVEAIRVERALIAVGRSPNVARANPQAAGVQLSANGCVQPHSTPLVFLTEWGLLAAT
jgi:pyruvate/2-oxoglutarate dehydrogenase complex dihydrolipoamide dehydrogenase (E3) component